MKPITEQELATIIHEAEASLASQRLTLVGSSPNPYGDGREYCGPARYNVVALGHPDGTSICAPLWGLIHSTDSRDDADAVEEAWRLASHYGATVIERH